METGEKSKEKASSQIVQDNVIIVHNFVQMFHAFAFLKIILISGHHVYDFDKEEKKHLIIFILCEFPSVAILNAYLDQALNYGGKASRWRLGHLDTAAHLKGAAIEKGQSRIATASDVSR